MSRYKAQLKQLIAERAIQFGEFVLSSGQKSDYYVDLRLITLDPQGAFLVAKVLLESVGSDVLAVGGPTTAADPIAGAVAAVAGSEGLSVRGFMVRKEPKGHGMQKRVEGPLEPGMRVVIVDDTVTTATQMISAAQAVEKEFRCDVKMLLCIIDRLQCARENVERAGYAFESIFTIDELLAEKRKHGS
ncbi:MAG: orotate phosphoribosyltransferase [Candidatus Latescibacterota bacterium]